MRPGPPRNQVLLGDAAAVLRFLPGASIDTVITSPPYFRLRDYGTPGQIGLEGHVDDWVSTLLGVLKESARVLVPTGTVWLNLGDSYSVHRRQGAPRKSLLLGPERLALGLIADGWTIRNKIVWAKPNTTPTSVRDRLATKHEVIYLLVRSTSYYFDLDSIRQPHISRPPKARQARRSASPRPAWLGPNSDGDLGLAALHAAGLRGHPLGKNPGDVWQVSVSTYRGAHFATYPPRLAAQMVLAGCPERRCVSCRRPWVRRVQRNGAEATRLPLQATCACAAGSEPGLVLDPFFGAGSTAVAARQHGRDWLGIEINDDYRHLALDRLTASPG